MPYNIQKRLTDALWRRFSGKIPEISHIFSDAPPLLDHCATVDLMETKKSGRHFLSDVFSCFGFSEGGEGYLEDKKNDFTWLYSPMSMKKPLTQTIPQIICADFRVEQLSAKNRQIVEKFATFYPEFDIVNLKKLIKDSKYDDHAKTEAVKYVLSLYTEADQYWPRPSLREYLSLKEENELMSWILLFGRRVNHFGIGIYHMSKYRSLEEFNSDLKQRYQLRLNQVGGEIKGSEQLGLKQSANVGRSILVELEDGEVFTHDVFLEFVWRYPKGSNQLCLQDFNTNFYSGNANHIIESLYEQNNDVAAPKSA